MANARDGYRFAVTDEQQPGPKDVPAKPEPAAGGSDDNSGVLDADEHEPDVEPFAGDDDILSGHLGRDE